MEKYARMKAALASAPCGEALFCRQESRLIGMNDRLRRLFGCAREEELGADMALLRRVLPAPVFEALQNFGDGGAF